MKKVTLGGDRLGSGNRMKVELHAYERSSHNLGYIWRSSAAPGTLIPFINKIALPGDTWDITLNADIMTHPTTGPLFGSYKAQWDVFIVPIRLYNGLMHNNTLNIGRNISQVKLPQIRLTATRNAGTEPPEDMDNCQINPSCLLSYLGIRGVGSHNVATMAEWPTRDFNATAILGYWDIVKNYYSNKQEGIGAVLHTPAESLVLTIDNIKFNGNNTGIAPADVPTPINPGQQVRIEFTGTQPKPEQVIVSAAIGGGTRQDYNITELTGPWVLGTPGQLNATYIKIPSVIYNWRYVEPTDVGIGKPAVQTFPLTELDHMRNYILQNLGTAPVLINTADIAPYKYLYQNIDGIPNAMSSQEGLALKTYQSDLYQNWLNTDWIDGAGGITEVTAIDTSAGSFTIDQLNISQKVYKMLNRIAVSDGSLDAWQSAVYDHEIFGKTEAPVYMGGLIKEVVFQEVVSNAQSDEQPLGTLAGKGTLAKKHKGGKVVIKVNEPAYIMGIFSLTPRIDYSQGNAWDVNLKTLDDLHKPALDEIGFQESINEQRAWWDTEWDSVEETWTQSSAGKIPAWMNYMTEVNKTYGTFAIPNNEMFMTLNRRYEPTVDAGVDIGDLTTYIDPSKFNFIFAETALDAQNFWVQTAVDCTVRRKMSAKLMPNL